MKDLKKISKALIPLSLMTMASLVAEDEIANNCCPPPACCPPPVCCVPKPKKCIDCECYNPKFYDLQCDWGMFIHADFLYWYASESNLEYANNTRYFAQPPGQPTTEQLGTIYKHFYLKSEWKPGVRVGIGMNSECDGWDVLFNWTYLDNNTSGSRSQPQIDPNTTDVTANMIVDGINDPWANPLLLDVNGVYPQWNTDRVSAKWSLIFNQLDLEFGKKYWVSQCFTLRPYTGLRGAWTHTNFRVNGSLLNVPEGTANEERDYINSNLFKNRYWGVGILGGLQPQFVFGSWCGCGVFSLYGNFEGALIWGEYRGKNIARVAQTLRINDQVTEEVFARPFEKDNYSRMQGILDLGIGLRWENYMCCDRYLATIDLGWEHHYWFDFGLYHRITGGVSEVINGVTFYTPTGTDNFVTNLGLGGFVLRFRLDF